MLYVEAEIHVGLCARRVYYVCLVKCKERERDK